MRPAEPEDILKAVLSRFKGLMDHSALLVIPGVTRNPGFSRVTKRL
jgi:hypothetical protein